MPPLIRSALLPLALVVSPACLASERFERVIEGIAITGNVGIVMGSEIVQPSAGSELAQRFGSAPLQRRFSNVFLFEDGRWTFLARQASVVNAPAGR